MDIKFTEKCIFVFPLLKTEENQILLFSIGVITVFILSFIG